MTRIGNYEADRHCFHHPELMTDVQVIRTQSTERATVSASRPAEKVQSTVLHHHRSETPCIGYYHEEFHPEVNTPA
jgi:hypothetical protein